AATFALSLAAPACADTITVLAAASLKGPLDEVVHEFEARGPHRVRVSYGASSALARQAEAGAPAQIFISADAGWVDYLEARGRAGSARHRLPHRRARRAQRAHRRRLPVRNACADRVSRRAARAHGTRGARAAPLSRVARGARDLGTPRLPSPGLTVLPGEEIGIVVLSLKVAAAS